MDNIHIAATERSPEINFNFQDNVFLIKGESYPEDVPAFFGPNINRLKEHLDAMDSGSVTFNFELIYFNSTSAKVIMQLFDLLEESADNGVDITVNWIFEAEDDNMEELGEEFGEDLEAVKFNLVAQDS
ncbi:MAG: DUF1987 domain-containing protein [Magnetococcales bacterium]|nr:DUF1987 domain-containing protein [Magnetococcales bacterium]